MANVRSKNTVRNLNESVSRYLYLISVFSAFSLSRETDVICTFASSLRVRRKDIAAIMKLQLSKLNVEM